MRVKKAVFSVFGVTMTAVVMVKPGAGRFFAGRPALAHQGRTFVLSDPHAHPLLNPGKGGQMYDFLYDFFIFRIARLYWVKLRFWTIFDAKLYDFSGW